MSAYLEEHLPHLQALHNSLGLPTNALEEDRTRINAAIKAVVVSIVRERETEVERWNEAIELARKDVVCLGKALGDRIVGQVKVEEGIEPLPMQHERLLAQRLDLEQSYRERLAKVDELQEALTALANLLGAPFEHPQPLRPIAGPSSGMGVTKVQARLSHVTDTKIGSRKVSGTSFKPETAEGRKRSSVNAGVQVVDESNREIWMEVSDEVIEALELDYRKATEERDRRRQRLLTDFVELRWLHSELALPPLPNGTGSHQFPLDLLPNPENEETPGAFQSYEKMLARFIATYKEDNEGEVEERGLDDLQPELGVVYWISEISTLWSNHKMACELRIQDLFNQIEPQWNRMAVDQEFMDAFFDINRGSGESAIMAYEAELERVLELRRASLSTFMIAVRQEIEGLWVELMMSDEEKDEFIGFIDDNYTEELLQAHEEYSELLRAEVESKATIIHKVREWHALVEEEDELERSATDPNRFKMRGGALLKEEKSRKRVQVLKPRIETELLKLLPQWELEAKRPFLIRGERVVDTIQDALEAKEAAKEAKKRARQGLGPAKTVKATPAANATRPPATGMRKRIAPEATPLPAGLKRQKVAVATHLKPMTTATTQQRIPQSTMSTASSVYHRQHDIGTPTPLAPCNLPRPPVGTGRAVSSSSIYMSKIPMQARVPSAPDPTSASSHAMLGKDASRRPKRESFRPRSSVMPGMVGLSDAAPAWDLGEVDEGEEMF